MEEQKKLMKAWASSIMDRGYTDNGLAYGSGVVVGENQVVTNCHVIRKTKSPWVSWGDSSYSVVGVRADPWPLECSLVCVFGFLNRFYVDLSNPG